MKAIAASLALALGTAAHAMTDPTRPPAAFAGDGSAPATPRSAPTLQSIIITPGTRAAIIDGERVEVGGRFGDAQVVSITEEHVVLRQHGVTEVLKLYPSIEKKVVKAPALKAPSKGRQP